MSTAVGPHGLNPPATLPSVYAGGRVSAPCPLPSPSCLAHAGPRAHSACFCPPGKFLSIFQVQLRYHFLQEAFSEPRLPTELVTPSTASLHCVRGPGACSDHGHYLRVEQPLISRVRLPTEPARPHPSSVSASFPALILAFFRSSLPHWLFFVPQHDLCIYSAAGIRNSIVHRSTRVLTLTWSVLCW